MESFAGADLHKRVTHQQPGLDRFLHESTWRRSPGRPAFITERQRPPSRVQRADLRLPPSKSNHSHSRVLHPSPPPGRRGSEPAQVVARVLSATSRLLVSGSVPSSWRNTSDSQSDASFQAAKLKEEILRCTRIMPVLCAPPVLKP